MGSVELLPPRRGALSFADTWRAASLTGGGAIEVRESRLEDYAAIRALQRAAAPWLPEVTLKLFESRRLAFPQGQHVAVCDGHIVGAASCLVVAWNATLASRSWRGITGDGSFSTHDPKGGSLYGAELLADASPRGYAAARALLQCRRRLCRRLNLRRIITNVRLAGYSACDSESTTPELYAMQVVWGELADADLRLQMAQGFHYCGIVRDYLPEDTDSRGHAALLAWVNSLYSPPRPPACSRKCA